VLADLLKDASTLRAYGAEANAVALERAVAVMQRAMDTEAEALLTIEGAALESGYSTDHLAREVRAGRIPNAGRKGSPRIRRGDLPRKPGALTLAPGSATIASARRRIARAIVNPEHGVHDDAA
jgi:hypothetical protein